jgi:hypothetical protein
MVRAVAAAPFESPAACWVFAPLGMTDYKWLRDATQDPVLAVSERYVVPRIGGR